MTQIYIIFAIAGWAWLCIILPVLLFRSWRLRDRGTRGFDVVSTHEKRS